MSDYLLTPEQEELLRLLVEAHDRTLPERSPFYYRRPSTSRGRDAQLKHPGWPENAPLVCFGDIEDLEEGGYIRRPGLEGSWLFELTGRALEHRWSSIRAGDQVSPVQDAVVVEADDQAGQQRPEAPAPALPLPTADPGRPQPVSPILVLDEIRGGWKHKEFLAELVGHGQFEGVRHKIGRAQLLLICLLFRSQQVHWIGGQQTTAVTYSEAGKELLKWKKRNHISVCEEDSRHPTHRIGKMWGRFVQQMERDEGLKGMFLSGQTDARGNKLICLRLEPRETQILIKDMSSLLKR